jgi:hypothetical protein
MAINQAVCATFKEQLLDGDHDISSDTIKLALYTDSATLDANTSAYSTSDEVGASGSYSAGGGTLAGANVSLTKTNATASTAFVDFDDLSFTKCNNLSSSSFDLQHFICKCECINCGVRFWWCEDIDKRNFYNSVSN